MTVLSWMAGFRMRTGWQFLSAAESADLSDAMRVSGGGRLRAIARHADGAGLACLDAAERDPDRARVLILRRVDARRAQVQEEHASLAAWLRALGLTSEHGQSNGHGRG